MTSEAKISANRQNAQHSTGPKSKSGKKRSSRNAVKHGIYSAAPLIKGEDAEAYKELEADVFNRFKPIGAMEERTARQIVNQMWRLDQIDAKEGVYMNTLVTRETARRLYAVDGTEVRINGTVYELESVTEKVMMESAKSVVPSTEDLDNAFRMAASDEEAIRAFSNLNRRRNSGLRGMRVSQDALLALQDRRHKMEEKIRLQEEDLRIQKELEEEMRAPPPPMPTHRPHRPVFVQADE